MKRWIGLCSPDVQDPSPPVGTGSAHSAMRFAISVRSNTASSLFVFIIEILENENAQRLEQVTGFVK